MKEYFTVPSKMRKLAVISLIFFIVVGTLILVFTYICDRSDRERIENSNGSNHIIDGISDYYYDNYSSSTSDSTDEIFDKFESNTRNSVDKFGKSMKNAYRAYRYSPFYFAGGFCMFLGAGSAITLLILASVFENKKKQAK